MSTSQNRLGASGQVATPSGGMLRVLVVAADEAARRIVSALGVAHDMEVVGIAIDSDSALRQAGSLPPQVIVMDDTLPIATPLTVVRQLSVSMPGTIVVLVAAANALDYVRQAILTGARAFVLRPYNDGDLVQTIRQAYEAEHNRRALLGSALPAQSQSHEPGRTIVLTTLKGGVGNTFVAVNLAVALHRQSGQPVALVEGPPGGDLAVYLNLRPSYTVADLTPQLDNLDAELLNGALTAHESGLKVLPCRHPGIPTAPVSPEAFFSVVRELQSIFRFVVVDCGYLWGADFNMLMGAADTLLILTTPELPGLRRAAVLCDQAQAMGYPMACLHLVVNRATEEGGLPAKEIAGRLQVANAVSLPNDRAAAIHATNRGIPLVLSNERHPTSRSIAGLAKGMLAFSAPAGRDQPASRQPAGRFGALMQPQAAARTGW